MREGAIGFSGGEVGDDGGVVFDVAAIEVDGHEGGVVAVDGGFVLGGEEVECDGGLFDEVANLGDLGAEGFVFVGCAEGVQPAFVVGDLFLEGLGGGELVAVEEEEGELHVGFGGDGGVVDAVGFGGGDGAGDRVGERPKGGDLGGGMDVHDFLVGEEGVVGDGESVAGAEGGDGSAEEEEALVRGGGGGGLGGGEEFLGEVEEDGGFEFWEGVGDLAEGLAVGVVVLRGVDGVVPGGGRRGGFLEEGEIGEEGVERDGRGGGGGCRPEWGEEEVWGFLWNGGEWGRLGGRGERGGPRGKASGGCGARGDPFGTGGARVASTVSGGRGWGQ